MAPTKFGLFKARSRDQQEQPSTENLLQSSYSMDTVATPGSPVASTSHADNFIQLIEMENMSLVGGEKDGSSQKATPTKRPSSSCKDDSQINYQQLKNPSTDATSTSTLQDDDVERIVSIDENDEDASTSCDANSSQLDVTSMAGMDVTSMTGSEISVHCGGRRGKKRIKEERQMSDCDMWQASNVEVMQNLLSRSGTLDEQIKWEAIATSRGLCTLTDNCSCPDCYKAKYLAGVTDGDGGLGAAPLFNAISVGCAVM